MRNHRLRCAIDELNLHKSGRTSVQLSTGTDIRRVEGQPGYVDKRDISVNSVSETFKRDGTTDAQGDRKN